jgi:ClpP class serine protease
LYNEAAQERYKLLIELEKKYTAKIVTITGLSILSKLDNRAAETVTANLNRIGKDKDAIIYLNTSGGTIEAGWKIAKEILARQANTTIIVTHEAKSVGTLISVAGTNIIARETAEFGPVDPQIPILRNHQVVYLPAFELATVGYEDEKIQAETESKKTKDYLSEILKQRIENQDSRIKCVQALLRETDELKAKSHSIPFFPSFLQSFDLNVAIDDLNDFCELHEAYVKDPVREILENGTSLVEMSIL